MLFGEKAHSKDLKRSTHQTILRSCLFIGDKGKKNSLKEAFLQKIFAKSENYCRLQ